MSDPPPNRNALWGRTIVAGLVDARVEAVCVAPGSRSTPLVVAAAEHPDLEICSILDERSAAYFALGRAKRTGIPVPVITTSGTAAAELHPAILEADRGRVPFLALTADRPTVLRDSGANQTVDQQKLYGDAVRWYREFPEPEPDEGKLRRLRIDVARAVASAGGPPAGPVHCNVPFAKPLAPTPEAADERRIADLGDQHTDGVRVDRGLPTLPASALTRVVDRVAGAERGLIVCGPADPHATDPDALCDLAGAIGFPIVADPLSGVRFGSHVPSARVPILGGYDAYLDAGTERFPEPDVVIRFGASPTSDRLRSYLATADATQYLVDPGGGWREAEFVVDTVLVADEARLARAIAERVDRSPTVEWHRRLREAERLHWNLVAEADPHLEGSILRSLIERAPAPSTITVANSMPIRDLDRFGRPREAPLTVLGNRGTSGIDGLTSTALGAGHATDDPTIAVLGDLAFYHDMNGLLAALRCDIDATIVVINNDGGGIFHALPIAEFDPPFTDQFRTPHGLEFGAAADQYGFGYTAVDPPSFEDAFAAALSSDGCQLVEVRTDAERSHRRRNDLEAELVAGLRDATDE